MLEYDHSALTFAAMKGEESEAIARVVAGDSVTHANEFGLTALHFACRRGLADLAETLVERGADLWVRDKDGRTPLDHALEKKQVALIDRLVVVGTSKTTPTLHAMLEQLALSGDAAIIKQAVACKKFSTISPAVAASAMITAVDKDNRDLLLAILGHGFDANQRDPQGQLPVCRCVRAHKAPMLDVLVSHGAALSTAECPDEDPRALMVSDPRWHPNLPGYLSTGQIRLDAAFPDGRLLLEFYAKAASKVDFAAAVVFVSLTRDVGSRSAALLDSAVESANMPVVLLLLELFPQLIPSGAWFGHNEALGYLYRENHWPKGTEVEVYSVYRDSVCQEPKTALHSGLTSLQSFLTAHHRANSLDAERRFVFAMYLTRGRPRQGFGLAARATHCWHCKTEISTAVNPTCPLCSWIRCPGGACEPSCPASPLQWDRPHR